MQAYWRHSPPTHVLVKTYMGYKPAAQPAAELAEVPSVQTSALVDELINED